MVEFPMKSISCLSAFRKDKKFTFLRWCTVLSFRDIDIIILIRVLCTEHLVEDTSHEQTELIEEGVEVGDSK